MQRRLPNRRVITCWTLSFSLHLLLLAHLHYSTSHTPSSPRYAELLLKNSPKAKRLREKHSSGSARQQKASERKITSGGAGYEDVSVGLRAATDVWIERVRAQIEPGWKRAVAQRIRERGKRGRVYCESVVEVGVSQDGTVTVKRLTKSCEQDTLMNSIALDAFGARIAPPPKGLAESVVLVWAFKIGG